VVRDFNRVDSRFARDNNLRDLRLKRKGGEASAFTRDDRPKGSWPHPVLSFLESKDETHEGNLKYCDWT
jgi:hypothetical protein